MTIPQSVLDSMVAHAREVAPHECCGLLVGTANSIDQAVRTTNIEPGPTRYRVDPSEHIALRKQLRGTRQFVTGAYHSHPRSSAEPSPSDVAEAFYPDFAYVIVSLEDPHRPVCRAWQISDGSAVEIPLVAVP